MNNLLRFILFLLVAVSLYGGLHFYGLIKIRRALPMGTATTASLVTFMLIMVFAPILVRVLESFGYEYSASFFARVGYIWMGFLFIFASAYFALDLYNMLTHVIGRLARFDISHFRLPTRTSCYGIFFLAAGITLYGFFEARHIRTERITIKTVKIPSQIGKIRIAQISDVHLGILVHAERLKHILNMVMKENPDILVSTGDLLDASADNLIESCRIFRQLELKQGKFAVTGNHEFYVGLPQALAFTEKSGFKVLRGESVNVLGCLTIAGIDDPAGKRSGQKKGMTEKALLSSLPAQPFTLLLKHRPQVAPDSLGRFDLQLSGHVHKGQIFPFSLVTRLAHPRDAGFYDLGKGSYLYVSRGSGTWGPPIRFLAPPEVTIIDLISMQ